MIENSKFAKISSIDRRIFLTGVGGAASLLASSNGIATGKIADSDYRKTELLKSTIEVDAGSCAIGCEIVFVVWRPNIAGECSVDYHIDFDDADIASHYLSSTNEARGTLSFSGIERSKTLRLKPSNYSANLSKFTPTSCACHLSNEEGCTLLQKSATCRLYEGEIFFIAADGKGHDSGFSAIRPTTIANLSDLIRKGGNGRTILFKRGDEFELSKRIILSANNGGSADAPVMLGAYGDGAPPTIASVDERETFWFKGSDSEDDIRWMAIRDLHIKASSKMKQLPAVRIVAHPSKEKGYGHLSLERLSFSAESGSPGFDSAINIHQVESVAIKFCEIAQCIRKGLYSSVISQNVSIVGCEFRENGVHKIYDWGAYLSGQGVIVRGNTFKDNIQNLKCRGGSNIKISDNLFYYSGQRVDTSFGGDKKKILKNLIIERNTFIGNGGIVFKEQGDDKSPAGVGLINSNVRKNLYLIKRKPFYMTAVSIVQGFQIRNLKIENETVIIDARANSHFFTVYYSPAKYQLVIKNSVWASLGLRSIEYIFNRDNLIKNIEFNNIQLQGRNSEKQILKIKTTDNNFDYKGAAYFNAESFKSEVSLPDIFRVNLNTLNYLSKYVN